MNVTDNTKSNDLAHGWEILEVHVEHDKECAVWRAKGLRRKLNPGEEVRTASHTLTKLAASIAVWVVVKRKRTD